MQGKFQERSRKIRKIQKKMRNLESGQQRIQNKQFGDKDHVYIEKFNGER